MAEGVEGENPWVCAMRNRPVQVLALALFLVLAASEFADAACYNSQQALPAKTIAQFRSDPAQLLSEHPRGGARMISMVRDLVASDQAALPLVLDLSANGNPDQINAIGTGLGQAALVCSRIDQLFANEIQQMVAASNNQSLALAFTEVLGDQQLAAAEARRRGRGRRRADRQQRNFRRVCWQQWRIEPHHVR